VKPETKITPELPEREEVTYTPVEWARPEKRIRGRMKGKRFDGVVGSGRQKLRLSNERVDEILPFF
jgi:hypothetical protein